MPVPQCRWGNGLVYFIQAGDGHTYGCVDRRRRELQCGSPVALRLLAVTYGGRDRTAEAVERALHNAFWGDRVRGEWFRPSESLLAFIRLAPLGNAAGEDMDVLDEALDSGELTEREYAEGHWTDADG